MSTVEKIKKNHGMLLRIKTATALEVTKVAEFHQYPASKLLANLLSRGMESEEYKKLLSEVPGLSKAKASPLIA